MLSGQDEYQVYGFSKICLSYIVRGNVLFNLDLLKCVPRRLSTNPDHHQSHFCHTFVAPTDCTSLGWIQQQKTAKSEG